MYRISYFDDEIEKITAINPLTGEVLRVEDEIQVFPAKHYITEESRMKQALADIEAELAERIRYFKDRGMFLEAQRIEQRTNFDLEMIRATGYCAGIENYSRHMDQRAPGVASLDADGLPALELSAFYRRIAYDRAADSRDVQRGPGAKADSQRLRVPAPECDG